MRNPPWTLPLVLALGFVGLRIGAFLWSLAIFACLVASVLILWRIHGRPRNHLHWIGLSFGPALLCAIMGQTTIFALLGYVLFFSCIARILCGRNVALALRPEATPVCPFGVVAAGLDYSLAKLPDPHRSRDCAYRKLRHRLLVRPNRLGRLRADDAFSGTRGGVHSCLVVALQLWINPHAVWLQYLAPLLGSVWALTYFWPRRQAWIGRNTATCLFLFRW